MGCQKSLSYLGAFAVALSGELTNVSLATPQLRVQSVVAGVTFPPASKRGAPARTAGGAQRGQCDLSVKPTLTVLAPSNNVVTTVSGNPTLFWYVPNTKAELADFMIFDNQDEVVYKTTLALKGVPGVVKLSLPATVSLQPGTTYKWVFSLKCDLADPSGDAFVHGWLERTKLSREEVNKLAGVKDPLKQAEMYAQAQVWQETLTILAQLRDNRPNDPIVNEAWNELLKSVDLEDIANQPLIECCTADAVSDRQ